MQGKLVFNQSRSTFLSLYRFSKVAVPSALVEWKHSTRRRQRADVTVRSLQCVRLFAQGEVRFGFSRYGHRLGPVLRAFVPRDHGVAAIGYVFDLVIAAVVGLGKIGSWTDDKIPRHIRVHIAEQRYDARFIEGKGPLFTLGPRPEIVSCFLVAADRSPEDIVLHVVAIQELNG